MELAGLHSRHAQRALKGKVFVPDRNAPVLALSVSAHRAQAHSDLDRRVLPRHALARRALDRRSSAQGDPHGRRTTALHVLQISLANGPKSARPSLAPAQRARIGPLVDLQGVAVLTAVARSRRSRGKSLIPIVPLVHRTNPMPPPVARLTLIVKTSSHPDRRDCRLKPWSQNASLRSVPLQAVPRQAAPQLAVRRFEVPALTGQALVVLARAVLDSSGRERTGQDLITQIDRDRLEQDRTGRGQSDQGPTALVLIIRRSNAPAVRGQRVAPVAAALGNSAQAAHLGPRATAHAPSPRVPANHVLAALAPVTNVPDQPRQGSPGGSPNRQSPADLLPEAAQSQPLVPDLADFRSPAQASKARPGAVANRLQAERVDRAPAVNAPAVSLEGKSEANKPRSSRMPYPRFAC